jgi:hypothetical protein
MTSNTSTTIAQQPDAFSTQKAYPQERLRLYFQNISSSVHQCIVRRRDNHFCVGHQQSSTRKIQATRQRPLRYNQTPSAHKKHIHRSVCVYIFRIYHRRFINVLCGVATIIFVLAINDTRE